MSNEGKKVKVHYKGTLDDGTSFDSSYDRDAPLEFVCGAGQMIKGFDAAVVDMGIDETKTVHLPASEAYGEYDPSLVQTIPLGQIPGADQLEAGQTVCLSGPGGQQIPAFVTEVSKEFVTFDINHALAGKDLNFEITLLEAE